MRPRARRGQGLESDHAHEDQPMPLVRPSSRRRRSLLHRHLQRFENRRHLALPGGRTGNPRETGWVGDDSGL